MTVQSWETELVKLIDCVDSQDFPAQLITSLEALAPFKMSTTFVYRGRSRPICLHDTFPDEKSKSGIRNYVNGTYVLNPVYRHHCKGMKTGIYRMRDIAPDVFYQRELDKVDDVSRSPLEEIGFVTSGWPERQEELIIAIVLGKETMAEIDLFCPQIACAFDDPTVRRLEEHLPLVSALFQKYWDLVGSKAVEDPIDARIDELFDHFGKPDLSDREQQVVQHILHGYSSESISRVLEISITTVKTHRKRAYAKLGISSQSELLSLFLKSAMPHLV